MNRTFWSDTSGRVVLLLIVYFVCVEGITLYYGLRQHSGNIRVLEEGTRTNGIVVGTSESGDELTNYTVYYTFTTSDGQTLNGSQDIDYPLYAKLKQGNQISVIYDPINPVSSFVAEKEVRALWTTILYYAALEGPLLAFGAFITVLVIAIGVINLKSRIGMRNS